MVGSHVKRFSVLAGVVAACIVAWCAVAYTGSGLPKLRAMPDDCRTTIMHDKSLSPGASSVSLQQMQRLLDEASGHLYNDLSPPTIEREVARRRVERTAAELWDLLDAGMQTLTSVTGKDAASQKVVSRLREDLDGYHMAMHRAFVSLRNVNRNEEWRTAESRRLGDLVQRRIEYIQNPKDCSASKKIVCDLTQICGFGCKMHHAVYCLQFAYATNRTFILEDKNMQYKTEKGWSTYFQPISNSCRETTQTAVNWNDAAKKTLDRWTDSIFKTKKAERKFTSADFKAVLDSAPVIRLPPLYDLAMKPDFLPLAIPADLAPRLTAFHGDPAVWWVGQFLRYVLRPNDELIRVMNNAARKFGFQKPIVGLHMRRTDKIDPALGEAPVIHYLEEYMGHVENYFRRNYVTGTKRRVYLATDDPNILTEAQKKYPNYTFISDNEVSKHASLQFRYEPGSMRGIIMDILFLSMTDYLVCTFSSNVGRAAYELMQTRFADASTYYRSLDDVFFSYGQNPHNLLATERHEARDDSELSIEVGDLLKSRGNYWEAGRGHSSGINYRGFTDALNWRTGKTGMFPSYKAVDQIVAVKMPTYPEVKEETDLSKIVNDNGLDFGTLPHTTTTTPTIPLQTITTGPTLPPQTTTTRPVRR